MNHQSTTTQLKNKYGQSMEVRASHWIDEKQKCIHAILRVHVPLGDLQISVSPTSLREVAENLLLHAKLLEATLEKEAQNQLHLSEG